MTQDARLQQTPLAQDLRDQLQKLVALNEEQLRLSRLAALGPDRVLHFTHLGEDVRLHVPFGDRDYIQRHILASGSFYEIRALEQVRQMGVVPAGKMICDLGANIGNHAVYFGMFLGASRIFAVEPQRACHRILERNIELNDIAAETHRVMLGEEDGQGEIDVYKARNIGGTSFRASETGGVPMRRLDGLLAGRAAEVGFMKIDVEGFQMPLLRGAAEVLEEARPALWIELFRDDVAEATDFLKPFGYRAERLNRDNYVFAV